MPRGVAAIHEDQQLSPRMSACTSHERWKRSSTIDAFRTVLSGLSIQTGFVLDNGAGTDRKIWESFGFASFVRPGLRLGQRTQIDPAS
jgi:hypothetical protein